MLPITHLLLKYQLQFYKKEIFARLVKFKHCIIIFIALTIPSLAVLNSLITSPFVAILKPEPNNSFDLISIFLVELFYIFIIAWQRSAFRAELEQYHHSLPIKKSTWRMTIAIRLLIANNIFLLPLLLLPWLIELPPTTYGKFIFLIRYSLLILYIFMGQLALLQKKYSYLVPVFLGDLLIALNGNFNNNFQISFTDGFLLLAALLPFVCLLPFKKHNNFKNWDIKKYFLGTLRWVFNFNINYLILSRKYKIEMSIRLFLAIIIMYGCSMLTSHSAISPQFLAIVLSSSLSLLMAGLFRLLKNSREEASPYLNALPISNLNWFMKDYLGVISITLLFMISFLFANRLLTLITPKTTVFLVLSIFVLPILLALFQNRFTRFATLMSATIVFIWLITIGLHLEIL